MGNNFTGHETIIRAIIDQHLGDYDGAKDAGLVNVWSLLPYQNPFWRGDLAEIRRILEGIGLTVNILFGPAFGGHLGVAGGAPRPVQPRAVALARA